MATFVQCGVRVSSFLLLARFVIILGQDLIQRLSMIILLLSPWWSLRKTLVLCLPLHPGDIPLHSFLLDGDHVPLDLVLLGAVDWAGENFVAILSKDVVDLAMLARDMVGQQILRLEHETTEKTLQAMHQVGVFLFNPLVEVACTVVIKHGKRFCLTLAHLTLEAKVAYWTFNITARPLRSRRC